MIVRIMGNKSNNCMSSYDDYLGIIVRVKYIQISLPSLTKKWHPPFASSQISVLRDWAILVYY
jgi:hypothetical protein